jgi:tight adherence protein C
MEIIASSLIFISLIVIIGLLSRYVYIDYKFKNRINSIFKLYDTDLISKQDSEKSIRFKLKLTQAGLSKKEFKEIVLASIVAGLAISYLIVLLELSTLMNTLIAIISLAIATMTPMIYVDEQRKARIKRIDNDLAIFLDLLIIILEGGGGLNNAIDQVTIDGESVLGKDLLSESKRFKYEFITYGSDIAYKNLASRTGSEAIGTIVGFMKLSEETGIGVKSIFENQAQEIKAVDMLNVEKKAAMMNVSLTFTMFLFILPAVIAMIVFPMMADALMPKF